MGFMTLVVKNPPANAGDTGSVLIRKIPWRRKWQSTPVFLSGESHGRGAWQATLHGVAKAEHDLASKPPSPAGRGVINTVKSDGSSQRPFLSFTSLLQVAHQRLFLAPSLHSRPCSQRNHNSGLILQEQSAGMWKSHTVTSLKQGPHFILMKKRFD